MTYTDKEILDRLTPKRQIHTKGVLETAIKLAKIHGEDVDKAQVAALFHDSYRCVNKDQLNQLIDQFNLDEKYKDNPSISHGKVAGAAMSQIYGIEDQDIINAVLYHTTGRANMSKLEKIIYLADGIEPGRKQPGVEEIRKLALTDLDMACLKQMENTIDYVKEMGQKLDLDTVEAKEWLLRNKGAKYGL